jgi:hypothetical protein
VVCPFKQECRAGRCVDPCAGVQCGENEACVQGACLTTCECSGCPAGQFCSLEVGQCVDSACDAVTCDLAAHCQAGNCVDDCEGALCPGGAGCVQGQCEETATDGSGGAGSSTDSPIAGDGGVLPSSAASATTSTVGTGGASSSGSPAPGGSRSGATDSTGCACRMTRSSTAPVGLWLLFGTGLAMIRTSRRKPRLSAT